MPVTLCVMLWSAAGQEVGLVDYEDQVLARLGAYGARVLIRVRPIESELTEVQVLEFPTEEALDAFLGDPERTALSDLRDRVIGRTEILRVDTVAG